MLIKLLKGLLKHTDCAIPHPHLFDSRFLRERRKLPLRLADQSADKQKLSYLGLCFCLLPRKRGSGDYRATGRLTLPQSIGHFNAVML